LTVLSFLLSILENTLMVGLYFAEFDKVEFREFFTCMRIKSTTNQERSLLLNSN